MLVLANQISDDRRALDELGALVARQGELEEQGQEFAGGVQLTSTSPGPTSSSSFSAAVEPSPPLLRRAHSASHDLLLEATASLRAMTPPCPCSFDHRNPKSIAAAILYQCQASPCSTVLLQFAGLTRHSLSCFRFWPCNLYF